MREATGHMCAQSTRLHVPYDQRSRHERLDLDMSVSISCCLLHNNRHNISPRTFHAAIVALRAPRSGPKLLTKMPVATRRSRRQSHVLAPAASSSAASSSAPTDPDEPLRQATAESAALLLEDGGLVVLRRVKGAAVLGAPQLATPASSGRQHRLCLTLHSRGVGTLLRLLTLKGPW